MNRDRFSLETISYVIIGLIFLAIFLHYYSDAFPTASIKLIRGKNEALKAASNFLEIQGYDLTNYIETGVFDLNVIGAAFLQQAKGMKAANKMMEGEVPLWRWNYRWFRPGDKQEFYVGVDAAGQVISFRHSVGEKADDVLLTPKGAEEVALKFMSDVMHLNASLYEPWGSPANNPQNEMAHRFEWQLKNFQIPWKLNDAKAGTGAVRAAAIVQGDKVVYFNRFFIPPEPFFREYQQTISRGGLLGMLGNLFMIMVGVVALILFFTKKKEGVVQWRFPLTVGLVSAAAYLIYSINSIPLIIATYPATSGYASYFGFMIAIAIVVAAAYCALILFAGASAEAITREVYPDSLKTLKQLSSGIIFSRSFFFSSVRGYALAFFFLGYVTLFYLIGGNSLGMFVPAEGAYSNLLSMYLPWLAPLSISLLAAFSEEYVFRFFSVSFLARYLKWMPAALIIPAMIWAFAHSSYAVYPVYVRGIELTIAGIIFGWFFIRFDLMTCIIAHYAIDAIFIGVPLIDSGNSYYVTSGMIVLLLASVPLLLGLPGIFKRTVNAIPESA